MSQLALKRRVLFMKSLSFNRYRNYQLIFDVAEVDKVVSDVIDGMGELDQQKFFLTILPENLPLQEQLDAISILPNYHKWEWAKGKKNQLKMEQRLSGVCRYYPGSPRNRIINAICSRDEHLPYVQNSIEQILGLKPPSISVATKAKRKTPEKAPRKARAAFSEEVFCESLGMTTEEARNAAENQTNPEKLFQYYVNQLQVRGTLQWRIREPNRQVILMNAFGSTTGNFMVSHLTMHEGELFVSMYWGRSSKKITNFLK